MHSTIPKPEPASNHSATASNLAPERQPFFYLAFALAVGITIDRWREPLRWIAAAVAVASIALAIRFFITKRSAATTIALLVSFAAAGAMLSSADKAGVARSRLKQLYDARIITPDDAVELTGALVLPPEPAPGLYYLDLDSESLRVRDEVTLATGRARLMVSLADAESKSDFERLALDYGSRIRVLVRLERARRYNNPGSPDFNQFLEQSGYDLKGTIKSPLLIEPLGRASRNRALAFLYHLRLRLMSAIDHNFEPRVAGTLKAMLAGNRYFIDPQASHRLREGATFHTLVISGFHISIIAWVMLRVRIYAPKPRRFGIVRTLIVILAIWAYTVMVGLAAPVTRATVMITVGLMGPLFFRRAASINTVSLAAFIMLAAEPALVADPGFQLSFAAVAGIVALALPLINKLRAIGEWRPAAEAPHPPSCSQAIRALAEALFWNERKFNREMRTSLVRYRLPKTPAARLLGQIRLQWLVRAVVTLIITSTAIQLSTMPLMALYFNRVAPVGVLLNIIAGMLTALLMLAAIAAITIGASMAWLSTLLGWIVTSAHEALVSAVVPFLAITGATFRVAHYEGWQAIIYGLYFIPLVMLAALVARWQPVGRWSVVRGQGSVKEERHFSKTEISSLSTDRWPPDPRAGSPGHFLLCAVALLVSIVAVARPFAQASTGKLTAHFLDVGQGDAALIIFPQGATMLVDAGGELHFRANEDESEADFEDDFSVGEAVVSRFLWSQGRSRIDYALATHAHADHIAGFSDVAENFFVGQAIIGHAPVGDGEFDRFLQAVAARGVPLAELSAGQRFELQGVTIEVLWPERAAGQKVTSGNDDSVVLRLVYGSVAIMLAGDIEEAAEDALVKSGFDLRADVLKVPHHGSKTSSTAGFVNAVAPECAIISVGERSRFGHPHLEVINRYNAIGARVFQTGRDGMVSVETDGKTIGVNTYRATKE